MRASRFRFFCFCGWNYRKEIIAGSGEVGGEADLEGGEGGGYGACGGEGEGDGGGRWRGIAEHEGVAAVPFRVVAVGLALFGVSAEEAGGGERVEVALGK